MKSVNLEQFLSLYLHPHYIKGSSAPASVVYYPTWYYVVFLLTLLKQICSQWVISFPVGDEGQLNSNTGLSLFIPS